MKTLSPKGLWLGLVLLLFAIGSTVLVFFLRPGLEEPADPSPPAATP